MGTIIKTSTGLIHKAARGFYSGEVAETGVMPATAVKRGRGRPRKETSEVGGRFDFSAFLTPVKLPAYTGQSRTFTKLAK